MADLQQQLQAILGDPEAMGQITAIARALTGGQGDTPAGEGPPAPPPEEGFVPVDSPPAAANSLPDLSALLGGAMGDMDPRLINIALRLFSEYSAGDDKKAALFAALRPFLRPERQEKLEKAEKLARLSRVVRVAMDLLKEEGGEHV